jgi:hypothetical protein
MRIEINQLTAALQSALTDCRDNSGKGTPHNPAVTIDLNSGAIRYESALHGAKVLIDLQWGFGSWEPEPTATDAEIATAAADWAGCIIYDMQDADTE